MKALVIDRYGGPEVAQLREVPAPTLADDELLIDVCAAGVNPVDFKIRDGKLKRILHLAMPLVLGNELSGVVRAVGARVTRFAPGDEVFARVDKRRQGAFAEQAAVQEGLAARKPANLTHVEAASIPLVGLTTLQAFTERAHLKAGDKVLIHAGAGGVGTFAIQLAKLRGATVATTASARNHELVKRLGADVVIDYTTTDFATALSGQDVVFDTLGGEALLKSFAVVKPGGTVVSIAAAVPDEPTARELGVGAFLRFAMRVLNAKVMRAAKQRGVTYRYLFMRPDGAQLAELAAHLESKAIVPVVDKVFPLAEAVQALAYVATGRAHGKVVIQMRSVGFSERVNAPPSFA